MHATMPVKSEHITITLPTPNPWQVKRGHPAHRGGGHFDRRTNRLRTRSAQRQVSLADQ